MTLWWLNNQFSLHCDRIGHYHSVRIRFVSNHGPFPVEWIKISIQFQLDLGGILTAIKPDSFHFPFDAAAFLNAVNAPRHYLHVRFSHNWFPMSLNTTAIELIGPTETQHITLINKQRGGSNSTRPVNHVNVFYSSLQDDQLWATTYFQTELNNTSRIEHLIAVRLPLIWINLILGHGLNWSLLLGTNQSC